ncbi:MAG: aminoacyl-tRNA hydrolase [Ilumatobacteraceae bacterium]|nr:aminoacyl-tRNA hydrolase [Ilumatobacteraceae bacterium]
MADDDLDESTPAHVAASRGLSVPDEALAWRFSRSSAPGGQHVNTSSTRAELRCDLTMLRGPLTVVERVRLRLGDEVRIVSQSGRSQWRNRQIALERLIERIDDAAIPESIRRTTRPSRGAVRERLDDKRKQAERKQSRKWRPDD